MLDDKKYEVNKEQLYDIKKTLGIKPCEKIGSVGVGEKFKVADYEFIVLEHQNGKTIAILKECLFIVSFGKTNNYDNSYVDKICNKFAIELLYELGENALVEFELNVQSEDKFYDFGVLKRKAMALTLDMYRKYEKILKKHLPQKALFNDCSTIKDDRNIWYFGSDFFWWLATPYKHEYLATAEGGIDVYAENTCSVCNNGLYNHLSISDEGAGVRPFCVFSDDVLAEVGL